MRTIAKTFLLIAILSISSIIFSISTQALPIGYKTTRLGGNDRFDTAIAIADQFKKFTSLDTSTVILGRCDDYADSLSIAPFAMYKQAPLLLTEKDKLTDKTRAYITQHNIKNVYIIGGIGVIGQTVEDSLNQMGLTVCRIGGKDRYETNRLIMAQIPISMYGPNPKIINGYDWIEGMSVAMDTRVTDYFDKTTTYINPIFMVSPTVSGEKDIKDIEDILDPVKARFNGKIILDYGETKINYYGVIVDETLGNALYKDDISIFDRMGISIMSGIISTYNKSNIKGNLFTISNMYNIHYYSGTDTQNNAVLLSRSDNFIDALASCPLSAQLGAPIVMATQSVQKTLGFSPDSEEWSNTFGRLSGFTQNIYYLGGSAAVPNGTETFLDGK